jgi:hypothetical protein
MIKVHIKLWELIDILFPTNWIVESRVEIESNGSLCLLVFILKFEMAQLKSVIKLEIVKWKVSILVKRSLELFRTS